MHTAYGVLMIASDATIARPCSSAEVRRCTRVTSATRISGNPNPTRTAPAATPVRVAVLAAARGDGKIAGWLEGKQLVKEIVVPGKLVNLVVR